MLVVTLVGSDTVFKAEGAKITYSVKKNNFCNFCNFSTFFCLVQMKLLQQKLAFSVNISRLYIFLEKSFRGLAGLESRPSTQYPLL